MHRRPASKRLHVLLDDLGIKNWDVLLVGDGSGSGWEIGCGWGCTILDRVTRTRKLVFGGGNTGTVNVAELMAYVHGMMWYASHLGKDLKRSNPAKVIKVHIITDSAVIVNQGGKVRDHSVEGVANRALWAAMNDIARQGYSFEYHWIERLSNELNWAADQLAGVARLSLRSCRLVDATKNDDGSRSEVSIYDINPAVSK